MNRQRSDATEPRDAAGKARSVWPSPCRFVRRITSPVSGALLGLSLVIWVATTEDPDSLPEPSAAELLEERRMSYIALAFSPDGRWLAASNWDGSLTLWDVDKRRPRFATEFPAGEVRGLAFSADGRSLAVAGAGGAVVLLDTQDGTERSTYRPHSGQVLCVVFSPDGSRIASGGKDGDVVICDSQGGGERVRFPRSASSVRSLQFTRDGRWLVAGGADGSVTVWQTAGRQGPLWARSLPGKVTPSLSVSPDGESLAAADPVKGVVSFLSTTTGRNLKHSPLPPDRSTCVAFSPDRRWLASASTTGTIELRERVSGRPAASLRGHRGYVPCLALSPDGTKLASGGVDGTLRLWSIPATATEKGVMSLPRLGASGVPNARTAFWAGLPPGPSNVQLIGTNVDLQRRKGQLADPGQGRHGRQETPVGRLDPPHFEVGSADRQVL
jgi:WD40 repeat protein